MGQSAIYLLISIVLIQNQRWHELRSIVLLRPRGLDGAQSDLMSVEERVQYSENFLIDQD